MDLPPVLPQRVRTKVAPVRRLDAVMVGLILVVAAAGVAAVANPWKDISLPPAERDLSPVTAAFEMPLESGVTYRSEALGGLTFTVDPSFAGTHIHIQSRRLLGIHTSSHDGIAVRVVRRVHDPETLRKVPAPEDLTAWLLAHPKISARRSGTLEVGGTTAQIVTVTDAQVPRFGTPCTAGLLEPLPWPPSDRAHRPGGLRPRGRPHPHLHLRARRNHLLGRGVRHEATTGTRRALGCIDAKPRLRGVIRRRPPQPPPPV